MQAVVNDGTEKEESSTVFYSDGRRTMVWDSDLLHPRPAQ